MEKFALIKSKWNEILSFIRSEYSITNVSYKTWLQPLVPLKLKNDVLFIVVPDEISLTYVPSKFYKYFQVGIEEVTELELQLSFTMYTDEESLSKAEELFVKVNKEDAEYQEKIKKACLNPKYTFESFVSGTSNELAHAASLAVAESPGKIYQILYLYGGVGLGKTHLMNAIGCHILQNSSDMKVLYITSETFTNEFIESIKNGTTHQFRDKYRSLDVLLIDDIQFIANKDSTQEEFFHTFNTLYNNNKQIIITSDKTPREIDNLEMRIRSRFDGGLVLDIKPPNYETRYAILRKKGEQEHYSIPEDVFQYIAENIHSNIRELEGALTRVVARSKLENVPVDIEMARKTLDGILSKNDKYKSLTPEKIISIVADHFNIPSTDILSKKRNTENAYPRQLCMYLACEFTDATLVQIGTALGNRHYSTVIYGKEKIAQDIANDEDVRNTIEVLRKKLGK